MKFQLNFKVSKPEDVVFDYLTDMQKFVSVHPLITKMDCINQNQYKVYERVDTGLFPYSFTYIANVESNSEKKTVVINAVVMRITKIEMAFVIKQNGNYSEVVETVLINTFLPIKSLLKKIFTEQHYILFQNIEKLSN